MGSNINPKTLKKFSDMAELLLQDLSQEEIDFVPTETQWIKDGWFMVTKKNRSLLPRDDRYDEDLYNLVQREGYVFNARNSKYRFEYCMVKSIKDFRDVRLIASHIKLKTLHWFDRENIRKLLEGDMDLKSNPYRVEEFSENFLKEKSKSLISQKTLWKIATEGRQNNTLIDTASTGSLTSGGSRIYVDLNQYNTTDTFTTSGVTSSTNTVTSNTWYAPDTSVYQEERINEVSNLEDQLYEDTAEVERQEENRDSTDLETIGQQLGFADLIRQDTTVRNERTREIETRARALLDSFYRTAFNSTN